jgi:hypothetical protein
MEYLWPILFVIVLFMFIRYLHRPKNTEISKPFVSDPRLKTGLCWTNERGYYFTQRLSRTTLIELFFGNK